MKRLNPSVDSSLTTLAVIIGVGLLLSVITVVPLSKQGGDNVAADGGPAAEGSTPTEVDGALTPGGAATSGGGPAAGTAGGQATAAGGGTGGVAVKAGQRCAAGANGGSTDTGVSGNRIKLAATVVDDGPGASFLAPVRIGMTAVLNRVNRAGGICGRQLELILRNDSWDAALGQQYIQNFVESEKVFALAVVPSSEGLRSANSYITQKQVPVVGTDGMLIHQYRNPWIWPVATSTISTMHVMAQNAAQRGAKHFGIVFDAKYHFGVEGAFAFNQAVKRITGADVPGFDPSLKSCDLRFCGIQPGKSSYGPEARSFSSSCFQSSTPCDFVALLLEPDTAVSFMKAGRDRDPTLTPGGFGGAQPLFNRRMAENCGTLCNGMWVWTGYNPPIEALAGAPAVSKYVSDIRQESSSADVANQFLEGGYVGMSLLVKALQDVGPNLTRANLRTVLDNITYDSGLSQPLTWRGSHFANVASRAFEIQYRQEFNGWRTATDFIKDPWVGQDIPAGE